MVYDKSSKLVKKQQRELVMSATPRDCLTLHNVVVHEVFGRQQLQNGPSR
ncbi:hypothetical protein LOAG_14485 [Loa loa]|uniref:Uncharacterized protein n=1 Tax=Loa loa TaxID=7209 RepID=A0A1S0THN8_LOALO|nr:hypothetical protein LOAG_14485 [Loa loa]EFO14040.1 hypothetical protein LOAG_14485 [Loa loa]